MRISIALCTHNGSPYLAEQLASLAEQRRTPDEVVAFDDASSDTTVAILESFAGSACFPVTVHRNADRVGSSGNYERALAACGGDVIALCDQDDVWQPGKLVAIERAFRSDPAPGAAFSDAYVVDEELRPLGFTAWQARGFSRARQARWRQDEAFEMLLVSRYVTGATLAFRSDLRHAILPFPPFVREGRSSWLLHDAWIALIVAAIDHLEPIAESLVLYRRHPTQQVGLALPSGWITSLRRWSEGSQGVRLSADAATKADVVEVVRDRLKSLRRSPRIRTPVDWDGLDEAAARVVRHLRARAQLSRRRHERLPTIWGELRTGRYHRYGDGARTALSDLARPARSPSAFNGPPA